MRMMALQVVPREWSRSGAGSHGTVGVDDHDIHTARLLEVLLGDVVEEADLVAALGARPPAVGAGRRRSCLRLRRSRFLRARQWYSVVTQMEMGSSPWVK